MTFWRDLQHCHMIEHILLQFLYFFQALGYMKRILEGCVWFYRFCCILPLFEQHMQHYPHIRQLVLHSHVVHCLIEYVDWLILATHILYLLCGVWWFQHSLKRWLLVFVFENAIDIAMPPIVKTYQVWDRALCGSDKYPASTKLTIRPFEFLG